MARGRKPGPPVQRSNGGWYCHDPRLKRVVRLNATTFVEAVAEQQRFYGVAVQSEQIDSTLPSDSVPESGSTGGDSLLNLDDDSKPAEPAKKADNAADLLSSWSKSTAPMAPTTGNVSSTSFVPPASTSPASPAVSSHPLPMVGGRGTKVQKSLTPEQSAKIASGLKKMVVNMNVVIVGTAIEMFGVVPAPLDQEEISLLQMGWEMWLDELFAKSKLKPVHLVIVGNIMIAVSMWSAGKKKEPKQKAIDPKAAPGHGASVTPITPPKQ